MIVESWIRSRKCIYIYLTVVAICDKSNVKFCKSNVSLHHVFKCVLYDLNLATRWDEHWRRFLLTLMRYCLLANDYVVFSNYHCLVISGHERHWWTRLSIILKKGFTLVHTNNNNNNNNNRIIKSLYKSQVFTAKIGWWQPFQNKCIQPTRYLIYFCHK